MRQYVRKYFLNPEKEERWINEMAEKGLGLTRYSGTKYEFEEIIPGEYTYRLYYLKEKPNSKEWLERLQTLEEMNITCAASFGQWVYLRKTAMNGPIEIDSPYAYRLTYIKRQHHIIGTLLLIELAVGACNLFFVMASAMNGRFADRYIINLIVMLIAFVLAAIFLYLDYSIQRQVKSLEKEEIKQRRD